MSNTVTANPGGKPTCCTSANNPGGINGARRLSDWVYGCQESMDAQDRPRSMGFPYGIIAQKPPELIAAPPLADAAVARRQAVWERVRARAHRQSVGLRTAQDGSEDAEQTRELVDAIVEESGGARDRETESTEGGGPSVSLNDIAPPRFGSRDRAAGYRCAASLHDASWARAGRWCLVQSRRSRACTRRSSRREPQDS